jgi:hypothetical protein
MTIKELADHLKVIRPQDWEECEIKIVRKHYNQVITRDDLEQVPGLLTVLVHPDNITRKEPY